ncbi:L-dopachrome tautomerase-related protein [Dysgonomonas macrotermitis]|uniref:Major royal jelly protein n=1 Tax=Dysgonomonas macrotermitis TaxID=1346286 RepID=A0A1M5BRP1_9BACT|nr:L-dopachrome tautomerase-related protein [Dysgonomonas macrotermitis]SHF45203.1 Major royal jelly protein [Dysgonomonas macrotermitis]
MKQKISLVALAFIVVLLSACSAKDSFEKVAESDYQWTGIAVSGEGRIFVNYPTWQLASPFKVAEIVNGKEIAYPSEEINNLFVCVQSVVIDKLNRLWVLDPANPQFKGVVEGGPKLYQIDIQTNDIVKIYNFPETVYTPTSYLNDVRIDTKDEIAYMTDSEDGGIIVLDLKSGSSWRALNSGCPAVLANLDGIDFKSTGKSKGITNSDGIELSEDNQTLYFSALTANILYQIPTSVLRDTMLVPEERCKEVSVLNNKNVPTDGMVLYNNSLYMADLPNESLWAFDLKTKEGRSFDFGTTIRWADSFAVGADGYIYFTTSQINYPEKERVQYGIYKFKPQ